MRKKEKENKPHNEKTKKHFPGGRENYEIPSITFVPVKLEERLMQQHCAKLADPGSHCSEPFQLS